MNGILGADFESIFDQLDTLGVLLDTDKAFPSLTGMVIGKPLSGSWLTHPRSNEIYQMGKELTHHTDVLMLKLLSGKVTYVHRRMWPYLIAIATAREPWQTEALGAPAKSLLKKVDEHGAVAIDELKSSRSIVELRADARTLISRLLVFGDELHTDPGAHAQRLESWEHWAWRTGFSIAVLPPPQTAKDEFERVLSLLNAKFSAAARLPWSPPTRRAANPIPPRRAH